MAQEQVYCYSFFSQNRVSIYALYVAETGMQRCFAGQRWGPEEREYYLFFHVISGKGEITVAKRQFQVTRNDVMLFYPHDKVFYHSDPDEPLEYAWVGFKGSDSQMLLAQTVINRMHPCIHTDNGERLASYLEALYKSHGNQSANSVRMIGYLYLYIAELLNDLGGSGGRNDSALIAIERAVAYIVKNYQGPITQEDLARHVCVSQSWLYRSFIRYLGISPVRYIGEYRIEQSVVLLHDSSMSIGAVAYAVGFKDPFYFSKVFRSIKNCSPTDYRQQYWQKQQPPLV